MVITVCFFTHLFRFVLQCVTHLYNVLSRTVFRVYQRGSQVYVSGHLWGFKLPIMNCIVPVSHLSLSPAISTLLLCNKGRKCPQNNGKINVLCSEIELEEFRVSVQ